MAERYAELRAHLDAFWPENEKSGFTWELGPIKESLPNFQVLRIGPISPYQGWVYVTQGAWEVDTGVGSRLEFFLLSPFETPRHVETLAMLANFHADPRYRLDIGRSVTIGRSWLDGSEFHHLLVCLHYPFGPRLENCQCSDGLLVRFLWALPISSRENSHLFEHGLESLEQEFDRAEIDYLDPKRPSVI